jgi:hypothetical protein
MTMTASRRAIVAGVASLPAIAALPAVASNLSVEPDPIFAAIEAHRLTFMRRMDVGAASFVTTDWPAPGLVDSILS